MNKNLKFNSEWMPEHIVRNYDAHIYFDPNEKTLIETLYTNALNSLDFKKFFIVQIIPYSVGPHPKGMLEINFKKDYLNEFLTWIQKNALGLSVLIHPYSDNDYIDHTENVIWIGTPLNLNFEAFKK